MAEYQELDYWRSGATDDFLTCIFDDAYSFLMSVCFYVIMVLGPPMCLNEDKEAVAKRIAVRNRHECINIKYQGHVNFVVIFLSIMKMKLIFGENQEISCHITS